MTKVWDLEKIPFMMFHIVLYQPEIPPNTGNIIRLAANSGCALHLIEPFLFELSDKQLRRAGLDYHELAKITTYPDLESCLQQFNQTHVFACTTKGSTIYSNVQYQREAVFLFGPETRGLPNEILSKFNASQKIKIPMLAHSRSLNLANAVSIIVYEAWRQNDFSIKKAT